jgi:hypothetical protein
LYGSSNWKFIIGRQDGTRCYYFTLEMLAVLWTVAGCVAAYTRYCTVASQNRKKGLEMLRVFAQVPSPTPT